MQRRNYLTLFGSAVGSVSAGCGGVLEESEPTGSADNTPTEARSEESTPTAPPASFEVVSVSAPDSANLGETAQFKVTVKNTGEKNGTWAGPMYSAVTYGPEPTDWVRLDTELFIPSGESRTWRSEEFAFEEPAVVYYRVKDGAIRRINIPSSRAPIIESTNLVSEWTTYGDAIDNRISEISSGSEINIASRYWYWTENQTNDVFRQVEIYNSDNDRIDIRTSNSEQVTENNGWTSWEAYSVLDSTGWGVGSYTAEMLIRDNQNQKVSNLGLANFQIV